MAEIFADFPIFFTGATGDFGRVFAKDLAVKHQMQVIAGTRDMERFAGLRDEILSEGGVEPRPFVADLTDMNQVYTAYQGLNLPDGQPLHFFGLSAGGYINIRKEIFRYILPLRQHIKAGRKIPVEDAQAATEQVKAFVLLPGNQKDGLAVNFKGLSNTISMLAENRHIDEDSVALTTSSSISDETDPDEDPQNPANYHGPWFYYPIGFSKAKGVQAIRAVMVSIGGSHIDMVAPEIRGTGIGGMVEDILAPIVKQVAGMGELVIPAITKEDFSTFTSLELVTVGSERIRTAYTDDGGLYNRRPRSWDENRIPYL